MPPPRPPHPPARTSPSACPCAGERTNLCGERQMTTELQAHSKALEDQTTNTARDVAILADKDKEYARQGQAKNKEACS